MTKPSALLLLLLLLLPNLGSAQETILLYPEKTPPQKQAAAKTTDKTEITPSLIVYKPAPAKAAKAAVLICPGGGYDHLAMDHEGQAVAKWLNTLGITAFVLQYRHGQQHPFPEPFHDAEQALRLIRYHAGQYNLDPTKIGIMGFSAGGHLASTLGTHFTEGDREAKDPLLHVSSRPDFMALIYPVITMDEEFTHAGSRKNLLGNSPTAKQVAFLSNETQVSVRTPITFLVHSADDKAVPLENSLLFYGALRGSHVPAQFHIFERGGHGYGLGKPGVNKWTQLCENWLRDHQVIR